MSPLAKASRLVLQRYLWKAAFGTVAIWLVWKLILVWLSAAALESGRPDLALGLRRENGAAAALYAEAMANRGDSDDAAVLARQALRTSTQSAKALRALAYAYYHSGLSTEGDVALGLAIRQGWRDQATVEWVFDRALANGDSVLAAQMADALLRTGTVNSAALARMRQVLELPGGAQAVADRVLAHPTWASRFVQSLETDSHERISQIRALLTELAKRGLRPSDTAARTLFTRLFEAGKISEAVALWRIFAPRTSSNPLQDIIDGDFSGLGTNPNWGPFGWQVGQVQETIVDVVSRTDSINNPALRVRSASVKAEAPLHQLLALKPGNYALSYAQRVIEGSSVQDKGRSRWELRCLGTKKALSLGKLKPYVAANSDWMSIRYGFAVPAKGCTMQSLILIVQANLNETAEQWFDDVRIENM